MSHTPGPWKIVKEKKFVIFGDRREVTPEEQKRFGCSPGSVVAPRVCECCPSAEATPANARLIAAAPDLLEACKDIESKLDAFSAGHINWRPNDFLQRVRAAIAKATGDACTST